MRDLLSVAMQQQRAAERGPGGTRAPRRYLRPRRALVALALVLFGAGLGALPFALDWSGGSVRGLQFKTVMGLAQQDGRSDNQKGTLLVSLLAKSLKAVRSLARLETAEEPSSELASAARRGLERVDSVLKTSKPDRATARRYPTWIDYEQALDELRGDMTTSPRTLDSIEVLTYNVEEAVILFHARRSAPDLLGQRARSALEVLRTTIDSR